MQRVQGEQRTKSAENKDRGECRVWEDEDKRVQEKGDRTVRENGAGEQEMETESVGKWRVQKNGESGVWEIKERECGRTESVTE